MCGIIAGVNGSFMAHALIDGLRKLEYRGYDSAGIAVLGERIKVRRAVGPVDQLELLLRDRPADGSIGIAHTRWATHGKPSEINAHPHVHDGIAVVQNGIIENHQELRRELIAAGHSFLSETDTEVIPHLIVEELARSSDLVSAIRRAAARMRGRYSIAVLDKRDRDTIVTLHMGSSLVIGRGNNGAWVASDDVALTDRVTDIASIEEGDIAILKRSEIKILDKKGTVVDREWAPVEESQSTTASTEWPDHTRREIDEQPTAVATTLRNLANLDIPECLVNADRIQIVACGSSYYAGMLARRWFEELAHIRVDLEIASELSTRPMLDTDKTAAILISQSGETADTIAALDLLEANSVPTVAIVNVARSQLARRADYFWPTSAGREIGVAATKTFVSQFTAIAQLALRVARLKGEVSISRAVELQAELCRLPSSIRNIFGCEAQARDIASRIKTSESCLFLGRGADYASAAEGALKLKELSYIHAEAYPAGELKHGPIAVIADGLPVIACASRGPTLEKTLSNLAEVKARGAYTVLITERGELECDAADDVIRVPQASPFIAPILHVVAMQFLAYHTSSQLGLDVDKPRNLAKSVTVE
ncbi:glutamine--fructose-6-phosphate transaminase (isomerizing) [Nisaea nitritireducens]|uniref:glutamine--fructose-6-phosphate transaminase (isomerizing) n=1 Tax=Nisaea nitritireducens TaxID=568392 RepID=UPI0018677C00|nr:glutamine--fructose-6-phosphate transaminase (isomerizing) [Nisaea nitritireducens]